jgi:putative tryptophan/tyrosine transport system substrate-binding protein
MTRRKFIALVGGMIVWPAATYAQQSSNKVWRVGILETIPRTLNAANFDAFRIGLEVLGYIEGRNILVEYRSADGRIERFPELARELVRLKVDVIVTRGTPAVLAAKAATPTIPIVMAASGGPLATGVVAGLARPGGNVTGLSAITDELVAKRLELLSELFPGLKRIAYLQDMGNPVANPQWEQLQMAARSLAIDAQLLDVRKPTDLGPAIEAASNQRAALLVGNDSVTHVSRQQLVELTAKHRVLAIYATREFVEAGGLISYAVSYADLYRQAAGYVDKILKGAKPIDLPIEQPTKFELVINLKTAKALGLTVPPSVLARADEVIE